MFNEEKSKNSLKSVAITVGQWLKHHVTIIILCVLVVVAGAVAIIQFRDNIASQVEKSNLEEKLKDTQSQLDKKSKDLEKTEATLKKRKRI